MTRTSPWDAQTAPSLADIERIALHMRDALPPAFRGPALAVALQVADFADDALLDDLDIDDPFTLTGLYQGVPITEKSLMDTPHGPDVIWLFRRPLLDEWAARGDVTLSQLVGHVYVHELAHHFGWSDADIARVDRWWE